MRKWIFALSAVAALAMAGESYADGCRGGFCGGGGGFGYGAGAGGHPHVGFMAAPWYLYWPYDAHFMTPAPMQGAYYAPPAMGYGAYGGYAQPYFPAHNVPMQNVQPALGNGGSLPPG